MSRFPGITGIVLAAGAGSRMGRTKQLLPFRGRTILECVVENALASSLQRVIVVLGHQADALASLLKGKDVTVIFNPLFESGQSTSLKAGLRAAAVNSRAVLFLLGDQPLVTPETINRILNAFENSSASPIVLPLFEGKRGNPVLFSRETFPRLEALDEDCGARPLFEEYAGEILQVAVTDASIHFDIDTEADYQRLQHFELQNVDGIRWGDFFRGPCANWRHKRVHETYNDPAYLTDNTWTGVTPVSAEVKHGHTDEG